MPQGWVYPSVHVFMKRNQYYKAHPSVHMFMKWNQYHKAHPSGRKKNSVPQGWLCIWLWKETNTIRRTIWVKGIFSATGLGVHFFMKRNQYHKAHPSVRKEKAVPQGWVCIYLWNKTNTIRPTIWVKENSVSQGWVCICLWKETNTISSLHPFRL